MAVVSIVRGWLGHPRVPLICALIAVVLASPALVQDFQLDDLFQRVMLLEHSDAIGAPEEMFGVLDGDPETARRFLDLGALPWWVAPELKFHFLRPMSTLTHRLDYLLWPDSAMLMHLHGLLWLGLLILAAGGLYRQLLGATWIAGLATLLFAVDDSHGYPAAWIANRNALIATAFGILALAAYHRWRTSGWAPGAWLSPLLVAASLLSGEFGAGTLAYFVAYGLVLDRDPLPERLRALVPVGLTTLAWLVVHRAGSFGAGGSGYYFDPFAETGIFLRHLPERAAVLLGAQFGVLPADTYALNGRPGMLPFALASLTLVTIVGLALVPLLRRSRTARFWALGMLLSTVPVAATMPSNRLLLFVGLGGMALLAELFGGLLDRSGWLPTGAALRAVQAVAVLLALAHLLISPVLLPVSTFAAALPGVPAKVAMASLPTDPEIAVQDLVVVTAPDYLVFVSGIWPYLTLEGRPVPKRLRNLSAWPSPVELRRTDDRTLRMRIDGGAYSGALGWLFRGPQTPLTKGETIAIVDFETRVLKLTADARPVVVEFRFAEPLESDSYRWVYFDDGVYHPFEPPELGQTVRLPAPRGPLEMVGGELFENYRWAKGRLDGD